MADTLAQFLYMARACGFVSNVLDTATGVKNSTVSRETKRGGTGWTGCIENVSLFYKNNGLTLVNIF